MPTYELTIKTELPNVTRTTTGYLILRPQSADAATGEATLKYSWGIRVVRTQAPAGQPHNESPGSPMSMFNGTDEGGSEIVIDAKGAIVHAEAALAEAQLESTQGPAWRLVLPPLPPIGQSTWTTHRQLKVYHADKNAGLGSGPSARVEVISDESITFTASPLKDGQATVQRKYELASHDKVGDVPADHIAGDGQYVFDSQKGCVTSLQWKLVDDLFVKGAAIKVPITVDARLLSAEEIVKIKAELEVADVSHRETIARPKESDAQPETTAKRNATVNTVPDGMQETAILGGHGGGPMDLVSADRKPVIGFKIETAEWDRKSCFRTLEPLFEKPEGTPDKGSTVVLAKDGYAVGSITVNADDVVHAFCITFMKKADAGLDPKAFYVSPWYGKKVGNAQAKLGGTGGYVYGICGRKGLNFDALGLVIESPPADDESTKK